MNKILTALALLAAAGMAFAADPSVRIMRPIVAGSWYPAEKDALKALIAKKLQEAVKPAPVGRVVACVLPHAPYEAFGQVAAEVCKLLKPGEYDRVIVLAAPHFSAFRGCSIPSVQAYETPLGGVPLDCPSIRILDRSTLIDVRSVQTYVPPSRAIAAPREMVHEREYTTEAVLPWLQEQLGKFMLVPILVGDFEDYHKKTDDNALEAVAKVIRPLMGERTLLVVSSDLTHFGNKFSYRPFRENIVEGIRMLDNTALDMLARRSYKDFRGFLEETQSTICGKNALLLMMRLLPKGAVGHVMAHEISAEKSGDTRTSISYASLVYTTPSPEAAP